MADYPGAIPDLTTGVPSDGDAEVTPLGDDTYPHDDHHRDLGQEVEAIATELGTSPSGASVDVAARFAAVEAVADAAQTAGEVAVAVAAHEADTSVHGIADTTVLATDAEVAAAVAAEAALARNADNLTSGTVADARIASTIARDSEVTAAISAHEAASDPHTGYQKESEKAQAGGYASLDGSGLIPDGQIPSGIARDSEVTAAVSAAINTLLDGAPGALDTLNELAAAIGDDADFAATVTAALAGKQPLDADLTAIAALSTTSFGRSLLELASSAAGRTALGVVIGTDVQAFSAVLAATTASFTLADETKLDGIEAGADVTDAANVNAAGAVMESDYDANTILKADSDNTPEALTVAEQRIVGRITGGEITGLTSDEVQAFIDDGIEGWHYVGDTDEPEFENSWDNLGFGQTELAFRKIGNVVYLAGVIWEGGGAFSTDTIFTLPSGYRPASACQAAALASDFSGNTVFAGAIVGTDGTVSPSVNPGDGTYAIYSFASGQWGFVLDPPSSA